MLYTWRMDEIQEVSKLLANWKKKSLPFLITSLSVLHLHLLMFILKTWQLFSLWQLHIRNLRQFRSSQKKKKTSCCLRGECTTREVLKRKREKKKKIILLAAIEIHRNADVNLTGIISTCVNFLIQTNHCMSSCCSTSSFMSTISISTYTVTKESERG